MPKNRINQIEPFINRIDRNELNKYLNSGGWITEHNQNTKFENLFKNFTKSKYAITFPNGTLTLVGILISLGIKKGDEVIVPSYTMVATANSIKLIGGKVIFADISKENLCLCPQDLIKKITKKTKAIIYVTLNGRSGFLDEITKICKKNHIYMIEDSAHSIGSFFKKKHHGNFGIASSFSFSMPKIITTGQGGMIVTNNLNLYKKLLKIKNFGRQSDGNDFYSSIGYNFKFTDLQATLGISQLKSLNWRIKQKKMIFNYYHEFLSKNKKIKFFKFSKSETPWFVDIYLNNPKKLQNFLRKKNIFTRLVYPSLDTLPIFNNKKRNKNANYYCKRGLWLPSSLDLNRSKILFISKLINNFLND